MWFYGLMTSSIMKVVEPKNYRFLYVYIVIHNNDFSKILTMRNDEGKIRIPCFEIENERFDMENRKTSVVIYDVNDPYYNLYQPVFINEFIKRVSIFNFEKIKEKSWWLSLSDNILSGFLVTLFRELVFYFDIGSKDKEKEASLEYICIAAELTEDVIVEIGETNLKWENTCDVCNNIFPFSDANCRSFQLFVFLEFFRILKMSRNGVSI